MVFQNVQPRGGAKDLAEIDPTAPRLAQDILQAGRSSSSSQQPGPYCNAEAAQDGPKVLWDPIPREDGQPSCELPAYASICSIRSQNLWGFCMG
jgi:hypothetical protein